MKIVRIKRIYVWVAVIFIFIFILGLIGARLYFRRSVDFLSLESDYYVADVLAGHVHKSYAKRDFPWSEHEKGRVVFRTDNLGFREDENTEVTKPAHTVRILVTGDSHTDGVVYNAESFPNVLERKLNSTSGTSRFEVINGGTGYYTFQNYAGFLQKYLYLQPDHFVVTVYTGNDFMEAIATEVKRGRLTAPNTPLSYNLKLRVAPAPLVSQALNQIVYFKTLPQMKEEALEIARRQLQEISETCLRNNIRFTVIFLPTKLGVEDRSYFQEEKDRFELTDAEMNMNQELKESLILWLGRQNVKYLDLTDHMRDKSDVLFWETDHHLNVKGHKLVADVLYDHSGFIPK